MESFKLAINGDQKDIRKELSKFGVRLNLQEKESKEYADSIEKKLLTNFDDVRYKVEKL